MAVFFCFRKGKVSTVFLCGIKGNGMSSLALILQRQGNKTIGCDVGEYFPTEDKLNENQIDCYEGFDITYLNSDIDVFIYSSAYENKDLVLQAKQKTNIESYSYPQYLAFLSKHRKTYAVCGTHGKTTTTAATTYALSQGKRKEFPFFSIYGSSMVGEDSITFQGSENLLIEACEYQDHFLLYELSGAVITSLEFDHPDYFKNLEQMISSYLKLALNIKPNGFLIINSDDSVLSNLIKVIEKKRPDLNIISYGCSKQAFITYETNNDEGSVSLPYLGFRKFDFKLYSLPIISDYIAASILSTAILLDRENPKLYLSDDSLVFEEAFITLLANSLNFLVDFIGVKRRLEFQGKFRERIFIEDYAHHPSEILAAINQIRKQYPGRKILTIFTPHTASRTKALFKDFVDVLSLFDKLIITQTFASARDDIDDKNWSKLLADKIQKNMFTTFYGKLEAVLYCEDENKLSEIAASMLNSNDICLTLGAANRSNLYKLIIEKI